MNTTTKDAQKQENKSIGKHERCTCYLQRKNEIIEDNAHQHTELNPTKLLTHIYTN